MDRVRVYGDRATARIIEQAIRLVYKAGLHVAGETSPADVAIAPLMTRKLTAEELRIPTLVFHPSLLPRHRGRDAIKWTLAHGDPYAGVTWFWADDGYDTGPICEQAIVEIMPGDTPRALYERCVDEGLVLLAAALEDLRRGGVRRRKQREGAATYDPPFKRSSAPAGV